MKRQAITFLSLFSLVMVLSVYYVMLPPVGTEKTEVTSTEEPQTEEPTMKEKLDESRKQDNQKQEEIISSSTSTSDEVNDALTELEKNKTLTAEEKSVTDALQAAGYNEVFVEINEATIKVTITKNDATKTDATEVMNIVLTQTEKKYSPEIKFVRV